MEICRKIRHLEYDSSAAESVTRDIVSSTEFRQDEKDFLHFCVSRLRIRKEAERAEQGFSGAFQKILPYAIATAAGYGVRIAQEKLGEYVEEGKMKAREDFAARKEKNI
jgi:hypothetical protein